MRGHHWNTLFKEDAFFHKDLSRLKENNTSGGWHYSWSRQTKKPRGNEMKGNTIELALLQLLIRNTFTPTTSMQLSAGPVAYSPTGCDDPGQRDSRLLGWGYGAMSAWCNRRKYELIFVIRIQLLTIVMKGFFLLQLLYACFVKTLRYKIVLNCECNVKYQL